MKFTGFEHGMGIGGWLTNYKRFNVLPQNRRMVLTVGDFEHFESYITEEDVKYIASLGMDHIRLGFDQIVLESTPYIYREEIFVLMERFVNWCERYRLNVVLNLHKAIGNYCDIEEDVTLLENEALQDRFVALWLALEKRFAAHKGMAFELLNEVRKVDPEQWNDLAEKTILAIRSLNATRKIIVGSTQWNEVNRLKDLRLYDDENVIYTFHFYTPFCFTHQQGVLQPATLYYNRKMSYPGDIERYREYERVAYGGGSTFSRHDVMDHRFLYDYLRPAVDFIKAHPDKILWLGEFGTIRHIDIRYRENYMNDVIAFCKKHDISYCVWNYLSTPNDGNRFSLVDDDTRRILSDRMASIIRGDIIDPEQNATS